MRLIDAEVLQKHLDDVMHDELCDPDHKKACFAISIYVDGMPTIAAEPVRHGEWVYSEYDIPHCSECGKEPKEISLVCPRCGAKMDGG